MNLSSQVQTLDALSAALSKAITVREKVKLADRIYEALAECERMVERFIVGELGGSNGTARAKPARPTASQPPPRPFGATNLFRGMKLADIGRALIKERGAMHGAEIEQLAKAGGFTGKAVKFQSYLAVAFKRDGGFKNLGRNVWDLV